MTNVTNSLNNLRGKVNDLDVSKLKDVPVDLKRLNNSVDDKVVKNAKFNALKTKVNNLQKTMPDTTSLIHINHYNIDKQNLEKKIGDNDKKQQIRVLYWLQQFWMEKLMTLKTKCKILVI